MRRGTRLRVPLALGPAEEGLEIVPEVVTESLQETLGLERFDAEHDRQFVTAALGGHASHPFQIGGGEIAVFDEARQEGFAGKFILETKSESSIDAEGLLRCPLGQREGSVEACPRQRHQ